MWPAAGVSDDSAGDGIRGSLGVVVIIRRGFADCGRGVVEAKRAFFVVWGVWSAGALALLTRAGLEVSGVWAPHYVALALLTVAGLL